jgi:MMPL family
LVRLTGSAPLADEEYGAIEERATINRVGTALFVLVILWLALKSPRIVLAVALCVVAGLAATAAIGLKLVGAFNLILAFGILFIGIGTDFAIQFSVRYRAERYQEWISTKPLPGQRARSDGLWRSPQPRQQPDSLHFSRPIMSAFQNLALLPAQACSSHSLRHSRFCRHCSADRFMSTHRYAIGHLEKFALPTAAQIRFKTPGL